MAIWTCLQQSLPFGRNPRSSNSQTIPCTTWAAGTGSAFPARTAWKSMPTAAVLFESITEADEAISHGLL